MGKIIKAKSDLAKAIMGGNKKLIKKVSESFLS